MTEATRRASRCRLQVATALSFAALAAFGMPHRAARADGVVRQAWFCETPMPAATAGCDWRRIELPHRWAPGGAAPAWASYRVQVTLARDGTHAALATGLSTYGRLRPEEAGTQAADAAGAARFGLGRYERYRPQLFVFAADRPGPRDLYIDVEGHPAAVNGLRSLTVADIATAQSLHRAESFRQVTVPLMLSAAAAVAGIVALFSGTGRSRNDGLLRWVGALALAVALRLALNQVASSPVPLGAWLWAMLSLLLLVDLLVCRVILAYLGPRLRGTDAAMWTVMVAAAALLAVVPAPARLAVAAGLFGVIGLGACGLLAWMCQQVARYRDSAGIALLSGFFVAVVAGLHDLAHHLGWLPSGTGPIQALATPVVLVLVVVLLLRQAGSRRRLASSLLQETARRRRLLQDLHDGVGSRLVALSFRARRLGAAPILVKGLDGLIDELRMIQRAVRAEPATLGVLLADLRDLYGAGADGPPMVWEIDETAASVALSADRAVATSRILQEALANALAHAMPCTITVRARRGEGALAAVVEVTDDGDGGFHPGQHGGLRNIHARAAGVGLALELESRPGRKTVRIGYPVASTKTG